MDTILLIEGLHVVITRMEDLREVQEGITHVVLQEVQIDTLEVIELQAILELLVVAAQEVIIEVTTILADTNHQELPLNVLQEVLGAIEVIQHLQEVLVVTLHHREVVHLVEAILVAEVVQEVVDADNFNQPY